jgi:ankyrin repeat protein
MRSNGRSAVLAGLILTFSLPVVPSGADNPSAAFYAALRANDLVTINTLLTQGAPVDAKDAHGVTPLMNAAAVGSADAMRLLLEHGADVNARNEFGSTALMWSATDLPKVQLLIKHGADVNVVTDHGRTALWLAADSDGSAPIVRALIAAGADTHAIEGAKMTMLHAATMGNDTETIRLMVDSGLDVNAADSGGFTPLINAAQRGNLAAVQMLLAKGANVNAVTVSGDVQTHAAARVKNGAIAQGRFTPLLIASASAPPPVVKTLIDAGADVNARDVRGMTPLMLAVASDHQSLDVTRTLIAARAEIDARSLDGETALDWARKSGRTPIVALLTRAGATGTAPVAGTLPPPAPVALTPAATRGFEIVERTSGRYFATGGCAACHAQNIADVAATAARTKGLHVDEALDATRLTDTTGHFASPAALIERIDVPGTPDVPLYTLLALASRAYAPDSMTDAMVANIAAQQYADGRWHLGGVVRPPIQDGDITRTALAIRALAVYAPPGRSADLRPRLDKARAWLHAAVPQTTQDWNFKLLGLAWAGVDAAQLRGDVKTLLALQRADGGWGQRAELTSDAYATGQTLFALATAGGIAASAATYQKGAKYLLSTQRADGSWHVRSRSPKFQPFFESGFPYGSDQWISAMATGWATAALATAMPAPPATHAVR